MLTSGLDVADIDYGILIFMDQENTGVLIIAADIDLGKSHVPIQKIIATHLGYGKYLSLKDYINKVSKVKSA